MRLTVAHCRLLHMTLVLCCSRNAYVMHQICSRVLDTSSNIAAVVGWGSASAFKANQVDWQLVRQLVWELLGCGSTCHLRGLMLWESLSFEKRVCVLRRTGVTLEGVGWWTGWPALNDRGGIAC